MLFMILFTMFICFLVVNKLFNDNFSKFVGNSFVLYWFGSVFLCTFQPLGLYKVSVDAYALLLIGGLSFIMGMLMAGNSNKLQYNIDQRIERIVELFLRNKLFLLFIMLITLYFAMYLKEALLYAGITHRAERVNMDSEIYSNNKMFVYVYSSLGFALFHFLNVLLWENLFHFKIRLLFSTVIITAYIITFCLLHGGRVTIMIVLIYFVLTFFRNHSFKIRLKFKHIIGASIGVFLAIILISSITSYRKTGIYSFSAVSLGDGMTDSVEKIIGYSTLPFVLFDRALLNDYYSMFGSPYLGRATFAGLDHWAWVFFRYFKKYDKTHTKIVGYLQDNWFPVSNSEVSNYAYSGLLYHYLDFGNLGIILFPLLFGFIFRKTIIRASKRGSFSLYALVGLCYFMMLHSVFTCYLIQPWVWIYMFLLVCMSTIENKVFNKI